jgi:hypothetical protein
VRNGDLRDDEVVDAAAVVFYSWGAASGLLTGLLIVLSLLVRVTLGPGAGNVCFFLFSVWTWPAVAVTTTTAAHSQLATWQAKRGRSPKLHYNLLDVLAPAVALTLVLVTWTSPS